MQDLFNPQTRKSLIADPRKYMAEIGYDIDDDVKIIVKHNTKSISYVVFNQNLSANELEKLNAAGSCAGTIGSVACAGCAATITSTASTGSTLSSVGTAGSKGQF